MARSKSEQLSPVERLAEQRREEAGRQLAQHEGQLRQEEHRLRELIQYRQDYCARIVNSGAIDAARLQDFNAFLARLDEAVLQQRQSISKQQRKVSSARAVWLQAWQAHRTMNHVVEKRREEERRMEEAQEQKEADETARLLFQAMAAGHLPGR